MGDTPIMKPLKEDVPEGMGGIIEQVADYRNYDNSIGFSFRFFATGMKANTDIKLLAINGIEPTPENIASGKYPFTASLYAITVKDNKKMRTVQPFLEWMQGPQGQDSLKRLAILKLVRNRVSGTVRGHLVNLSTRCGHLPLIYRKYITVWTKSEGHLDALRFLFCSS